jgi:hypothetical protein
VRAVLCHPVPRLLLAEERRTRKEGFISGEEWKGAQGSTDRKGVVSLVRSCSPFALETTVL